MQRLPFNEGWGVRLTTSPFLEIMGQAEPPKPVTLPHDWLISQPRSAENEPGSLTGFYGEGVIEYVKTFQAPPVADGGRIELDFDGVFRGAMVYINDSFVGQRPYGYIPFSVRIDQHLKPGENVVRVETRNHADSRWYSGSGIFRDVDLLVGRRVHVARNGVRIRTDSASTKLAVIDTAVTIENDGQTIRTVAVRNDILDLDGAVVASETDAFAVRPHDSSVLRQRFAIDNPKLWSADRPTLHRLLTTVSDGDEVDVVETTFGIRMLEWDALRGLAINGESVKLRGGCIHHDNGIIGAATISRAEERRVELLKEAGYNAIRSAHNPTSKAMLEACDRLGMLVLDEFTDGWTTAGLGFGYGLDIDKWWRADLTEMLERDYNHPSVIMYSIGNEVADTGNQWDAIRGRDMVEHIKAHDPTRPITNAINPMMTVLHDLKAQVGKADEEGGVNSFMRDFSELTKDLVSSDLATERLAEPMSQLDIAGYNYAYGRYELDIAEHPQRLLLGTEGVPGKLDEIWDLVERHPQVLGEFSWTAWEYIGEAGLGADKPAAEAFFGNYPWRLSATADIGVTGIRRSVSYWRETIWGLRSTPYIAVARPTAADQEELAKSIYTWSDSLGSWSWDGHEGTTMNVEVYSDADEIALELNGVVIDRQPVGAERRCIATFKVVYQPGELTAIAYRSGEEAERTSLRSATRSAQLAVVVDRDVVGATDRDLAYVDIRVTDESGVLHVLRDTEVQVAVRGTGILQGLGSGNPRSEEDYSAAKTVTHDGRALAVIRPTGPGEIIVEVTSAYGAAEAAVTAR